MAEHSEMQSAQKHIIDCSFVGQPVFCFLQGIRRVTNARAIAKVASAGVTALQKLRDSAARFIDNGAAAPGCIRIKRFPRDFCSAASRKGALL
ncbi:hypothetical protein [Bradyrhizobium neotropicale]|nr:hypothetical protein [Bradyrhizobium neotropicale]